MPTLKEKTAKGLFWSLLDSFGVYLIKFIFSIIIARMLFPGDYGIMGMIVIFISLGQLLMQGGFSMALVQKKDVTDTDYSTVFWFNFLVSIIIYLLLFILAEPIADFFKTPVLVSITRVAGLNIIFNALIAVQAVILSRILDFKKQAWINLFASLFSGITGVMIALKGFGVWALVFQTLTGSILNMAGYWFTSNWRPGFIFNIRSFLSLFNYGYKIFLQGLGDIIFTKIYFPLIGRLFPVSQLGYYTNASRFYDLFVRQVSSSVGRVVFPAFSAIQDQKEKFSVNYLRSFFILSFVMSLLMTLLIITSNQFVEIFLTSKWLPAVPLMIVFFIEGFYFPLFMLNQNLLCSLGMSGLSLKIDLLKKGLVMISIFIALRYGIKALIIGQIISTFMVFLLSTVVLFRILKIDLAILFLRSVPVIIITGISFLLSRFIIEEYFSSIYLVLLLKVSIIPLIFLVIGWVLKLRSFLDLKAIIIEFIKVKSGSKDE